MAGVQISVGVLHSNGLTDVIEFLRWDNTILHKGYNFQVHLKHLAHNENASVLACVLLYLNSVHLNVEYVLNTFC